MNGLPQDVNLAPLLGRAIEQIRFSRWSIQLLLEGAFKIVVEGRLTIRSERMNLLIDDYSAHATEICSLIGSKILDAQRTQDGGMEIQMSSGQVVCIQNSQSHYESFQVHFGESVVVA